MFNNCMKSKKSWTLRNGRPSLELKSLNTTLKWSSTWNRVRLKFHSCLLPQIIRMQFLFNNKLSWRKTNKLSVVEMKKLPIWFRYLSLKPASNKYSTKTNAWSSKLLTLRSVRKMSSFTESPSKHRKSFKASTLRKKKMTRNDWTFKRLSWSKTAKSA